jgi:hypothetical protein
VFLSRPARPAARLFAVQAFRIEAGPDLRQPRPRILRQGRLGTLSVMLYLVVIFWLLEIYLYL